MCCKHVILRQPDDSDFAFTAGLLHDLGKLALAANYSEMYAQALALAQEKKISETEAELSVFQATHAEMGACLLAAWGLPRGIVEAVAWHHHPMSDRSQRFNAAMAVHAANALDAVSDSETSLGALDLERVDKLGLSERIPVWKGICHPRDGVDF
jgi:putative nucleotidyltransferase with HDIG domain